MIGPGNPHAGLGVNLDRLHHLVSLPARHRQQLIPNRLRGEHDRRPNLLGQRQNEVAADAAILAHAGRQLLARQGMQVVAQPLEGFLVHVAGEAQHFGQLAAPTAGDLAALRVIVRRLEVFLDPGSGLGPMNTQHVTHHDMNTVTVTMAGWQEESSRFLPIS